jgi:hypothetical protein
MTLPYNTTTITIYRPSEASSNAEPYSGSDNTDFQVVAKNVRAQIGTFSRTVSATEVRRGGESSTQVLQLACDIPPCGLTHHDKIVDETTGEGYQIDWCFKRIGLGLDHYTAELFAWDGLVG